MYSSQVGRFVSEDPIGLDSGESNFYRYAGNDPVNTIDPSGERGVVIPPLPPRTRTHSGIRCVDCAQILRPGGSPGFGSHQGTYTYEFDFEHGRFVRVPVLKNPKSKPKPNYPLPRQHPMSPGMFEWPGSPSLIVPVVPGPDTNCADPNADPGPDGWKWWNRCFERDFDQWAEDYVDQLEEMKSRAEYERLVKQCFKESKFKDCEWHHIASNKGAKNPYTIKVTRILVALFRKVGMDLDDKANLCYVCRGKDGKHKGPHPRVYHEHIISVVEEIVNNPKATPAQKAHELRKTLVKICACLQTPGCNLRALIVNPKA